MSKDMDFYYSQEISPINIAKIIGYWYKRGLESDVTAYLKVVLKTAEATG